MNINYINELRRELRSNICEYAQGKGINVSPSETDRELIAIWKTGIHLFISVMEPKSKGTYNVSDFLEAKSLIDNIDRIMSATAF